LYICPILIVAVCFVAEGGLIEMTIAKGFTLIELLITLLILGILLLVSTSSYQSLFAEQSISHVVKQVYYTLKFAKSEAVKRNQRVYVQFCEQDKSWKMGISDTSGCDCFTPQSCLLGELEMVNDLFDGPHLMINDGDIRFSGSQASYGPLRFSVETGSITFTNSKGKQLSVIQSAMRLRICSPDQDYMGYKQC